MPILTANGTAIMGIGCSDVVVNNVTPPALRDVACKGGTQLLGPSVVLYQICTDDDGNESCALESFDILANTRTVIDTAGANVVVGNGFGDWAAGLIPPTGAVYRDSFERTIPGAMPISGDDVTGKWIAVQNYASSMGLVVLDRFGGVEVVTDGIIEGAWIRNGVVSYVRGGTRHFWPSGETSSTRTLGVRHSGTGWCIGYAMPEDVTVIFRLGETTGYIISDDDRDFNADIIEQGDGTLLIASSTTQGEAEGSLRQYVVDVDALTITRLFLPPIAADYTQTLVEVEISGSLVSGGGAETTDSFIDPYGGFTDGATVTLSGGTEFTAPPGSWTPPPGVNLSRDYLTQIISETWFNYYGVPPPSNELEYWIKKCQEPDTFSDGYVRVGWNDYWKARMAPGNDGTSDVALAGTAGIIGTAASLGWPSGGASGTVTGIDVGGSDDYVQSTARAEPLSEKAARGITPQLGLLEDDILYNLALLAVNVLEPLKQKYPNIVVVSGFRQVNTGISQHERGEAADLQLSNQTPELLFEVADYIAKSLQFDQLVLNYSAFPSQSWIHVSFTADALRREVLTRDYDDAFHSGLLFVRELSGEERAAALREQQEYATLIDAELKNLTARDKKLNPATVYGDVMLASDRFNSEASFDCGIPAPIILPFDPYALVTRIFDRGDNGVAWNLTNPNFEGDHGCGRFVEAVVRALPPNWGHLVRTGYAPKAYEHAVDAVLYRSPTPLYNNDFYQIVYVIENAGQPDARPIWLPTCAPVGASLADAPQGGWSRESTDTGPSPVTVSAVQYVYPIADTSAGNWEASSGTVLYSTVDEAQFPSDTDYVESPECDGTLLVELRQESIVIASHTYYRETGTQTLALTLTAAQRALITNWSALSVWCSVNTTDTLKLALGPIQTPAPGDVVLRVRVDMGL